MSDNFTNVGAVVGATLGGFLGLSASKKRRNQALKVLKANTKQAYDLSQSEFTRLAQTETQINKKYRTDSATQVAQMAASGVKLTPDTLMRIEGRTARVRDEALTQLGVDRARYTGGEAYNFLKKDFEYMSGINTQKDQRNRDVSTPTTYSIRTEGRSGESFYTAEQQGMLRNYTDPDNYQNKNNTTAYQQYAQSVTPGMDEYLASRFGSDEDKAVFESTMTERITEANKVFDDASLQSEIENTRRRESARLSGGG